MNIQKAVEEIKKENPSATPEDIIKMAVVRSKSPRPPVAKPTIDIGDLFTKRDELQMAKDLLKKYLADYNIETESDKNLLKQLIYLEVFHNLHLQRSANEFNKDTGAIPLSILDALHKNINQIIALKERLGLSSKNADSSFNSLKVLQKKFKIWAEENQGSRHMVCPHCGKMTLLKIRMDAWETQKHPFFKDRILANKHLLTMYKEGKITKKDVALVLGCSDDYIDWVLSKINLEQY